jgi:hypothetical protein
MAFGFPASYTYCVSTEGVNVPLQKVVKRAIDSLDWTIDSMSEGIITASVGFNIWSYGERIVVDYFAGDRVSVTSSCIRFTQFFDWGKNKQNVNRLLEAMRQHIY